MSLDFLMNEEAPVAKPPVEVSDEFRVLSDKEHILMRPGMYIGSTSLENHEAWLDGKFSVVPYVSGLLKCAFELVDNAVDEAIRTQFKHANKISVSVDGDVFTIEDNGRGIPQDLILCPDGRTVLRPEAAWTMTKSGSNFNDDRATMGMNGVGSALANYFSSVFLGETGNGKKMVIVSCSDNCDRVNVATRNSKFKGTKVKFIPDFKHFECDRVDDSTVKMMQERVQTLAISYPEIEFKFNGQKMDNKFKRFADLHAEHYVSVETAKTVMLFTTTNEGFRHNSFVNGLNTKMGGVHVNTVFERLADEIIPLVKTKYKLDINRARVKECTTLILFLRGFVDPKFNSQTKDHLANTSGEVTKHIEDDINYKKLARKIVNTDELIMPIIESALARKLAAEKAAETKAAKNAKKAKVAKHIKANRLGEDGVETTLFLTEGDSAIGYLLKVRDGDTQGGFPLRGKPLTTWKLKPVEIMKNKEMFEIMSILNLTMGESSDDMTYSRIAIMPDADVDGTGAIYPSLLSFFYRFWPELLEQHRILFIKTPQMISTNGKAVVWSYDLEEHNKRLENGEFRKGTWDHRHIKGLGSLTEEEYEQVVRNLVYEVPVADETTNQMFDMLYGGDETIDQRKEWMQTASFN